jgi:hypothetical protein
MIKEQTVFSNRFDTCTSRQIPASASTNQGPGDLRFVPEEGVLKIPLVRSFKGGKIRVVGRAERWVMPETETREGQLA